MFEKNKETHKTIPGISGIRLQITHHSPRLTEKNLETTDKRHLLSVGGDPT